VVTFASLLGMFPRDKGDKMFFNRNNNNIMFPFVEYHISFSEYTYCMSLSNKSVSQALDGDD
jgi:hypothetical protein